MSEKRKFKQPSGVVITLSADEHGWITRRVDGWLQAGAAPAKSWLLLWASWVAFEEKIGSLEVAQ